MECIQYSLLVTRFFLSSDSHPSLTRNFRDSLWDSLWDGLLLLTYWLGPHSIFTIGAFIYVPAFWVVTTRDETFTTSTKTHFCYDFLHFKELTPKIFIQRLTMEPPVEPPVLLHCGSPPALSTALSTTLPALDHKQTFGYICNKILSTVPHCQHIIYANLRQLAYTEYMACVSRGLTPAQCYRHVMQQIGWLSLHKVSRGRDAIIRSQC